MMNMRRLTPVLVVALLFALVFVGLVNGEALAQQARQRFEWVIAKRLTVENNADIGGAFTVAGAANLAGNSSVGGTFSVTGDTAIGGDLAVVEFINPSKAGSLTVTGGGTITPTASFQPLTAAITVGAQLGGGVTGQVVMFVNVVTPTITITDTGTGALSGNAVLGQNDTLTVVFDGTNWVQIAKSDN